MRKKNFTYLRERKLKFFPCKKCGRVIRRFNPRTTLYDWMKINSYFDLPSSYFSWLHYDGDKYVVSEDDLPF